MNSTQQSLYRYLIVQEFYPGIDRGPHISIFEPYCHLKRKQTQVHRLSPSITKNLRAEYERRRVGYYESWARETLCFDIWSV